MKNLNETVEGIARAIGLDDEEIGERMRFLEFSDADGAALAHVHGLLQEDSAAFSAAFYDHLLGFPALRALLPDGEKVARLRHTQSAYFEQLTAGAYGRDYIHDRLRVGVVHQRIGLGPKWYIGAYRKYLSELLRRLWELLRDRPDRYLAAYDAVLKVVCFDMGLALDTYAQAAQERLLQQRNYLEQIIGGMPAGLVVLDAAQQIRSMNPMMRRMLGLPPDAAVAGRRLQDFLPAGALRESVAAVAAGGGAVDNLLVMLTAEDGSERHFECNLRRTTQAADELVLLIAKDVSLQMQARQQLQESEEQFRLIFTQAALGIAHTARDGRLIRVNPKLGEILGYAESELLGRTLDELTHPDDREESVLQRGRLGAGEVGEYAIQKRYMHKAGHPVWVNVTVSAMRDAAGKLRCIALIEDITRRKEAEEELVRVANFDALTRLPNRLLLQDRLSQAIAQAHRAGRRVAVMFIDLDRFKNINDSLGHGVGDEVIVATANRLSGSLRECDTVARQGGDEFVVVLPDVGSADDAAHVAQKLLAALAQPLLLQGQELFPTGSIGISLYPDDGADSQALLKHADTAMYRAKAVGRNNFKFYADDMGASALGHLRLEGALRRALEREEFTLHYQPQIDLRSGQVVGVEALLRWQPAGQAMVAPADFIPIAEDTGLIVPIGDWVLAKACAQHRAWRDAGLPDLRVSVNLSARQFQRPNLVQQVAALLDAMGCDAGCIALEITESVVMDNPEAAAETLRQLSEMGVHLAIDDFGTGYSSLSYLKRFPIDTLKIDRSFVRDIGTDFDDAVIVKSVIALAHSMRLSVVAEGVEDNRQLDFLSEQGCDQMQGFLFSRPMPAEDIALLLQNGTAFPLPWAPRDPAGYH